MGDLGKIPSTREAFKALVTSIYPDMKAGAIPNAAGQMYRFVHVAKVSDYVIFRSKIDKKVHVGRIQAEYEYRPDVNSSYPHLRKMDWLAELEPTNATQGALYEIGSAMSFFQVKSYADEWIGFLTSSKAAKVAIESDIDETITYVAASIEENTRDFVVKQLSKELKGHPFASFVAQLLNMMGYRTRVSPEGADGGVDIIAHRDELGFEPPIIRVQVKSTDGNVGQPEVSALLGTLSQGEYGLFVSLSNFTNQAKMFAKNKGNLRLIDRDELVNLTLAHYDQLDARYKGLLPLKQVYVPEPIDS